MLNIYSKNLNPELEYSIEVVFRDFLGLEYKLQQADISNLEIHLENGAIIEFHSDFSQLETIPEHIEYTINRYILEDDIPVLFGDNALNIIDNKIYCGIDIFRSIFFMLSRIEEKLSDIKDKHGRFPFTESLAYKNNFLHRPVVNEYIEMLWNMLVSIGYGGYRKEREYKLILTHDVDHVSFPRSLKSIVGDIIKRWDFKSAFYRIKYLIMGIDPFDTFDWLMRVSEENNIISRFYFMSGGNTSYDNQYSIKSVKVHNLVKNIKNRGHIIGYHSSYNTYNNLQMFKNEISMLETEFNLVITEGRQHFLKFENPVTFNIWEENNMEIDSTLSYAGKEGFRCGTGDEYRVFDLNNRKVLTLKERPLVVMEGSLWQYQGLNLEESLRTLNMYKSLSKKYNMFFTVLFHNSSFGDPDYPDREKSMKMYEDFVKDRIDE